MSLIEKIIIQMSRRIRREKITYSTGAGIKYVQGTRINEINYIKDQGLNSYTGRAATQKIVKHR